MNKQRFQALAAAYGGAISRWPITERGAARLFAFSRPGSTRDSLRDERRVDSILQRSANPILGLAMRKSMIESAVCLRETARERRSWFGAILGAGLAAACAAGIGAGFAIAPLAADSLTSPMDPAEVAASALGNPTEFGDG